jgi:hypothetical protein
LDALRRAMLEQLHREHLPPLEPHGRLGMGRRLHPAARGVVFVDFSAAAGDQEGFRQAYATLAHTSELIELHFLLG